MSAKKFCAKHPKLANAKINTGIGLFTINDEGKIRGLDAEQAAYFREKGWEVKGDDSTPIPFEHQIDDLEAMNARLVERNAQMKDDNTALFKENAALRAHLNEAASKADEEIAALREKADEEIAALREKADEEIAALRKQVLALEAEGEADKTKAGEADEAKATRGRRKAAEG